ncbi:MAG TPA: hypothetical protein DCL38_10235 [Lachnospiraceae bacterium]|nr:hypothetical protein [Lachnospiraceae bacterium]
MNALRTRKDIEIDFVKACNQSRELMDISNSLFKIAGSDMMETMAMMRLSWQGSNAESFYDKTEKLRTELMNNAEDLVRIANHINHTADIIYHAEMIAIGVCS